MSYRSLDSDEYVRNVRFQPKTGSQRAKVFDRVHLTRRQGESFDELPLVSAANFSRPASTKNSVGSSYHEIESFPCDTEYDIRSQARRGASASESGDKKARSVHDHVNTFLRRLRASGPASQSRDCGQETPSKGGRLPTGWRLGTWVCCATVVLCVILELSLLSYALSASSDGRGIGVILIGNCKKVRELELWLLLPLNIAGTMLIGTSNYVMQVVSAPERAEINQAHAYARHVPVGGLQFRDLRIRKVNRARKLIWWTLCLSSIPIHFLLNVAVFSSVQASNTGVLVVQDNFDQDKGWGYCKNLTSKATIADRTACLLYQNYTMGGMKHYSASDCLRQYSEGFQTNASSVIVTTDKSSQRWFNPPTGSLPLMSNSYGIPCGKNSTGGVYVIPNPGFNFFYSPSSATTQISTNFQPYCRNITTTKNGVTTWKIEMPINTQDYTFQSHDELILNSNSAVGNITSIKAFFSAFQYRYWGSAWSTGDFARDDLQNLMNSKDPRSWICPRQDLEKATQCNPISVQQKSEWRITPNSMLVKECHILPKEELCTLRYSSTILIITLCFDLVKLSAMIIALKLIKRPLATLGDIIASFLREPDPCTEGFGPLTEKQVLEWTSETIHKVNAIGYSHVKACWGTTAALSTALSHNSSKCPGCKKELRSKDKISVSTYTFITALAFDTRHRKCLTPMPGRTANPLAEQLFDWLCVGGPWWTTLVDIPPAEPVRSLRWASIISRSRLFFGCCLFLPAVAAASAYFAINFRSLLAQKLADSWMTGFNAPDPNSMLTGWLSNTQSIYVAAIIVNLPQVAFSTLYFIFNATLTLMHTVHEWSKFSVERKALRVSSPRGQQRSTYWLQLPWSYSIPLIITSGGMHWLLSRSLYMVKVDMYGYLGERLAKEDYFACGYSPAPALLLVVVLMIMAAALVGLSCRILPGNMPIARLNSLAISSACHANPAEENLELKPLMFGTINGYYPHGRPYRSFSARPVVEELAIWLEA